MKVIPFLLISYGLCQFPFEPGPPPLHPHDFPMFGMHHHWHHHDHPPFMPWSPFDFPPSPLLPPFPHSLPPPIPILLPVALPPAVSPPSSPPSSPYTLPMTKVISHINKDFDYFSQSGQSYENVVSVLKDFYNRKSGNHFDFNSFKVPQVGTRSEFSANQRTAGILYENDVVLTLGQARAITQSNRRSKRKVIADLTKRWTTTISYKFGEHDDSWKTDIRSALSMFSSSTCLSFIENGNSRDYILFSRGEGCYSAVGKLGGAQEISLGEGCDGEGVISHEIAHALGLWHEQSRPDRNSYVRINVENVINGAQAQFELLNRSTVADYGIPYDYGSVMHYPSYAFSRGIQSKSIETLDKSYMYTIGSRTALSFLDIKALNKAYCSKSCPYALPCQNNGYPHPNACNRCLCPTGFGGKYCENLEYSAQGQDIMASSNWKTIQFSGSTDAFWRIRAPSGVKIVFEITSVWFKCSPTCEEFVEIKYGNRMDQVGSRLCCRKEFGQRKSSSNQIIVIASATIQSNFSLSYKLEQGFVRQTTTHLPTTRHHHPIVPVTQPSYSWSGWTSWTGCTELCGACGKQERTRQCIGSTCGLNNRQIQKRTCNLNACQAGATRGRGKRSILMNNIRIKRQSAWCCSGYHITSNNWCSQM